MTIAVFVVALLLAQAIGIAGLRRRGYELLCTATMAVLLLVAFYAGARVVGLA